MATVRSAHRVVYYPTKWGVPARERRRAKGLAQPGAHPGHPRPDIFGPPGGDSADEDAGGQTDRSYGDGPIHGNG